MSIAAALKIDARDYEVKISAIDVQLNRLNDIRAQYEELIRQMGQMIFNNEGDEDVENYRILENRAKQQIDALDSNIKLAQTTRAMLAKTVQEMKDNGTNIAEIIGNSINVAGNTIGTIKETAEAAAAAAGAAATVGAVAAIL